MPTLTPADVSSKLFARGMRGYNMEEVDTFLDEVEQSLTSLLRENADLRARLDATSTFASAEAPFAPEPGPERPTTPASDTGEAEPSLDDDGQEAALRTLLLAQRTADQAIAEARAEADELVSRARAEAIAATESARHQAEQSVSSARTEAEQILRGAQEEAERLLGEATERTASADAEVQAKMAAAMDGLVQTRRDLEAQIEQLRAFEREYRSRLRAYLEGQLRDLHVSGPSSTGNTDSADTGEIAAPATGLTGDSTPRQYVSKSGRGASFPAVQPAPDTAQTNDAADQTSPFARSPHGGASPGPVRPTGAQVWPTQADGQGR